MWRKAKEAILTYQLEKEYKKNFLFEKYLNVVEFGDQIFGVKRAAQFYFAKTPAQLDVLESAFLAFLLPNPRGYSVSFRKRKLSAFAKSRLKHIVWAMWKQRDIDDEQYHFALDELNRFLIVPSPDDDVELETAGEPSDDTIEMQQQALEQLERQLDSGDQDTP